jgi:hypothetical protein
MQFKIGNTEGVFGGNRLLSAQNGTGEPHGISPGSKTEWAGIGTGGEVRGRPGSSARRTGARRAVEIVRPIFTVSQGIAVACTMPAGRA